MRVDGALAAASPQPDADLRNRATEFEGILLKTMLDRLQRTFAQTESSEQGDPASETISDMGTQALANALAARNVLGIGAMVAKQLQGTTTPVTTDPVNSTAANADGQSVRKNLSNRAKEISLSADNQDERQKRLL